MNQKIPKDAAGFARFVENFIRNLYPYIDVRAGASSDQIYLDGTNVDLENLRRYIQFFGRDNELEMLATNLQRIIVGALCLKLDSMSLTEVTPRIMPRIQPLSLFRSLQRDLVPQTPFVNNTVIVYVVDAPYASVNITTKEMMRWGVSIDWIEETARSNLTHMTAGIRIAHCSFEHGMKAFVMCGNDSYDAARLLLGDLHQRFQSDLGREFFVAIPARDQFVAIPVLQDEVMREVKSRIANEFKRLPSPISPHLFLVTQDGVAGTIAEESW